MAAKLKPLEESEEGEGYAGKLVLPDRAEEKPLSHSNKEILIEALKKKKKSKHVSLLENTVQQCEDNMHIFT